MASNNKNSLDNFVRCIDCKNATAYYQWQKNPIVAQCSILKERQVAETNRLCKLFSASFGESRNIQHFNSYEESDHLFDDYSTGESS